VTAARLRFPPCSTTFNSADVQAIRSPGKQPRLYVTFPLALAAIYGFAHRRIAFVGTVLFCFESF